MPDRIITLDFDFEVSVPEGTEEMLSRVAQKCLETEGVTLPCAAYLRFIAIGYPFQALARSAGTVLQSTQRVSVPFIGAACSVLTNIVLNAVLIFGLCGFPAMGVEGAAITSSIAASASSSAA